MRLLGPDEPDAVRIERRDGRSPFVLICEHAGRQMPKGLGGLGLGPADLIRHIAWDIGAEAVARGLSERLDAPLVLQRYSRLVVDCNRPLDAASLMPAVSETTRIPGNSAIPSDERTARLDALYHPFHAAVRDLIESRQGRETLVVAIHSFTPVFNGVPRPWHAGMIFNRDGRLGRALIAALAGDDLDVGENVPYSPSDLVDFTTRLHAEERGLAYAMIEIRNDLIGDPAGQEAWSVRLAEALEKARAALRRQDGRSAEA